MADLFCFIFGDLFLLAIILEKMEDTKSDEMVSNEGILEAPKVDSFEPTSMKDIVDGELKQLGKRAKRRLERIEIQKEKKKIKKAAKREEREKQLLLNPRNVCPRARGVDADPEVAEKNRLRNRGNILNIYVRYIFDYTLPLL